MTRARVAQFLLLVLLILPTRVFAAPTQDQQVQAEYDKILSGDIADANFGAARRKLTVLERCKKRGACTTKTTATVNTMLGVVLAQMGQREAALQAFAVAFEADPKVEIPPNADITEATKRLFGEARAEMKASHARPDDPFKGRLEEARSGDPLRRRAWREEARRERGLRREDQKALEIEENVGARIHLADCLDASGRLVDSARELTTVIEKATVPREESYVAAARQRAESLVKRLGHLKFEVPAGMPDLRVTFDDWLVPKERLATTFVVDPAITTCAPRGRLAATSFSTRRR